MIAHQNITMSEPLYPPDRLGERGEEHFAMVVIGKDPFLPVPPHITW
jgi:hypothetical protein